MGRLDKGYDMTAFTAETRQNKRNVGSVLLSSGGNQPFLIPKTGFLQKLWLLANVDITVTLGGGTASLDPILGIWGMLNRITVSLGGTKTTWNTSGYGAYMMDLIRSDGFVPTRSGLAVDPAHSARVYNAPNTTGNVRFALPIPVAPNDEEMVGGFLNLYEAVNAYLTLQFPTSLYSLVAGTGPFLTTGAATVVAGATARFDVATETFELPQNPAAYPPQNMIHTVIEQVQPITGVGDTFIQHPISNIYMQILYQIVHNSVPNSMFVDGMKFTGRRSLVWYDQNNQYLLSDIRDRYNHDLDAGVFVNDFFYQGRSNYGGFRDMIDGASVSELQTTITIGSGATIAGQNFARYIQRQLEPIG